MKLKILDISEEEDCYIVKLSNEKYIRLGINELKYLLITLEYDDIDKISFKDRDYVLSDNIKDIIDKKIEEYSKAESDKVHNEISMIKLLTINPDKFLKYFYKFSRYFYSMPLFIVYIILNIMTFFFMGKYNTRIAEDLQNIHLDISSIVYIYITMLLTVMLHELGHATVCKKYGGKVTKMGMVLFFLTPSLYCDVSDIYMFNNRKGKMFVSLAGIYVNSFLSLIAICMYFMLPQGGDLCNLLLLYYIASVGFIIYNLIPFVKLDGYWFLASVLNVNNFYMKSSICTLTALFDRKLLKKANVSRKKRNLMVTYGFISLVFRPVFWTFTLFEVKRYLEFNLNKYVLVAGLIIILTIILTDLFKYYKELIVKFKTQRASIIQFI